MEPTRTEKPAQPSEQEAIFVALLLELGPIAPPYWKYYNEFGTAWSRMCPAVSRWSVKHGYWQQYLDWQREHGLVVPVMEDA